MWKFKKIVSCDIILIILSKIIISTLFYCLHLTFSLPSIPWPQARVLREVVVNVGEIDGESVAAAAAEVVEGPFKLVLFILLLPLLLLLVDVVDVVIPSMFFSQSISWTLSVISTGSGSAVLIGVSCGRVVETEVLFLKDWECNDDDAINIESFLILLDSLSLFSCSRAWEHTMKVSRSKKRK